MINTTDELAKLKAYLIYALTFVVLTSLIIFELDNSLGESIARGWLFTIIVLAGPLGLFKKRVHKWLLSLFLIIPVFIGQGYLCYQYLGYDPHGEIDYLMLGGSIIYYVGVAFTLAAIVRKYVWPDFNEFG